MCVCTSVWAGNDDDGSVGGGECVCFSGWLWVRMVSVIFWLCFVLVFTLTTSHCC